MTGKLSIVATPIGNLEDITLRALRTFKECDVVLCEDTRVTRKLLSHYEISAPTESYHTHSSGGKSEKIMALLEAGKHLALVTDAGTPGISDPGSELVRLVREKMPEVRIESVPGASALSAALSIAGLTNHQFVFRGFIPHKKGRETMLTAMATGDMPNIAYESTHRITKTIEWLAAHYPEVRVTIVREISKLFEEVLTGAPAEILEMFQSDTNKTKGEFVLIVENL